MRFATVSNFQALGGRLRGATIGKIPGPAASVPDVARFPGYSVVRGEGLAALCRPAPLGLHPPASFRGVPSLGDLLSMTGMDVSFVRVLPGSETPFAMRHRKNEVVYIVSAGRGEFLVDGEVVEVAAGSVLRVGPPATRAWRNTSNEDLCLVVVQARAGRARKVRRSDAVGLPGLVRWWR